MTFENSWLDRPIACGECGRAIYEIDQSTGGYACVGSGTCDTCGLGLGTAEDHAAFSDTDTMRRRADNVRKAQLECQSGGGGGCRQAGKPYTWRDLPASGRWSTRKQGWRPVEKAAGIIVAGD